MRFYQKKCIAINNAQIKQFKTKNNSNEKKKKQCK